MAIDCFGPLIKTSCGNTHICVMIDHHTRWVELVAMRTPDAAVIAEVIFKEWISRWGVPRTILSDNGKEFNNAMLAQLCNIYGISKVFCAPYHPRGNSIVESYMRSLRSTLHTCVQHFKCEWDQVLSAAAFAYRATPHTITRYSPYFLVSGQNMVLPLSRAWSEPVLSRTGSLWLNALWKCRVEVIRAHDLVARTNWEALKGDKKNLKVGMWVAVKLSKDERREGGKFSPLYRGPFEIVSLSPLRVTAAVRDVTTGVVRLVNRCNLKFLDAPPTYGAHWLSLPTRRFL